MPDTALPVLETAAARRGRTAASTGFLARRFLKTAWFGGPPAPWSLRWILDRCQSEIDWSVAEWTRLSSFNGWGHEAYGQSAPYRLPHEIAAGRVLSIANHCITDRNLLAEYVSTLKSQRKAAADYSQRDTYRAYWAARVPETERDIASLWGRRRRDWRVLVQAIADYRGLREEIGDMKEAV